MVLAVLNLLVHIPDILDLFSKRERQDICFALFKLKEAFLEAFFEQQTKNLKLYDELKKD